MRIGYTLSRRRKVDIGIKYFYDDRPHLDIKKFIKQYMSRITPYLRKRFGIHGVEIQFIRGLKKGQFGIYCKGSKRYPVIGICYNNVRDYITENRWCLYTPAQVIISNIFLQLGYATLDIRGENIKTRAAAAKAGTFCAKLITKCREWNI